MKFSTAVSALSALSSAAAASVEKRATLPAVTVKGNAFYTGTSRFFIRGVDVQPGGSSKLVDPLADPTTCKRDIAKLQQLGINAIRVYTVDNSVSHDECMSALAAAGMYLILDVNTPFYSINRAKPAPSYNAVYLQNVFATIDSFAGYTNTLAFFSANEVINDANTTNTAPYVKAVTRDMRAYIKARGYRQIPVGYSAADIDENRMETAQYMNCGTDAERSDFFAFNDYSWCDPDPTSTSWSQKVQNFSDYSIPLFLSEYGCNANKRTFTNQVKTMYSQPYANVFSGGMVYEYSQEPSNYGLVTINADGTITDLPDFAALKSAYSATPNPTGDLGASTGKAPSKCPARSATWAVEANAVVPAFPSQASIYFTNGAGKGVGLSGTSGSQDAGPDATAPSPSGQASGTGSVDAGSLGGSGGSGGTKKSPANSIMGAALFPAWTASALVGVTVFAGLFL